MLNLYRRHRKECQAGHLHNSCSGEFEERKKGWKRCECPIFLSGTLQGSFKRYNTAHSDWESAETIARQFESAGNWNGTPQPSSTQLIQTAHASPDSSRRVTIADAIRVYLAHKEAEKIEPATLRQHRTFTKKLTTFAEERGYVMLDQITQADIDLFYASWKLGARAKANALGKLKSFFRFCARRKWVAIDATDPRSAGPVSGDLKPPKGANREANKAPFTDQELLRIIDACDHMPDVAWSSGMRNGVWTGEDVKDFIWVMVYTGLRISDVCLFSMSRVRGNEVFLRAKKNGGDVYAYLPDWLRDRLVARAERCGVRPFVEGSDKLETVTDLWRRRINKIFALAGKFEEPPTPHRFRHTYARILLERGVPVADVADLLGDDEATVRMHYSRWVASRQARLTNILKYAFEDKPKPRENVVAIRG